VITFLISVRQTIRQVVLKLSVSAANSACSSAQRTGGSVNDPVVSASCPESRILSDYLFVTCSCRAFQAWRLHVPTCVPFCLPVNSSGQSSMVGGDREIQPQDEILGFMASQLRAQRRGEYDCLIPGGVENLRLLHSPLRVVMLLPCGPNNQIRTPGNRG